MWRVISAVQEYGTWDGVRVHPAHNEHHYSTAITASKVSTSNPVVLDLLAVSSCGVITIYVCNIVP